MIGYARVSTEDQSTDMQIAALNRYQRPDGRIGCDRIFSENRSGASRKRPELQAALDSLREGDTFVVWKLDRLARSAEFIHKTVREITEETKAKFVSMTEAFDTSTAMGRAFLGLLAVFAEFERAAGQERTRAGIQKRREQGHRIGRKPKLLEAEQAQAQAFRDAGMSIRELAARFNCSTTTISDWTVDPSRDAPPRRKR